VFLFLPKLVNTIPNTIAAAITTTIIAIQDAKSSKPAIVEVIAASGVSVASYV